MDQDEDKPVTRLVEKHKNLAKERDLAKEQTKDTISRNMHTLKKAEQAVHNYKLALKREQNYENRTEKTVRYLAGQLKNAQKDKMRAKHNLNKKKAKKLVAQ